MTPQLTAGCCQRIASAEIDDSELFNTPHTVQLLSVKQLTQAGSANTAERYRVIISDGIYFIQAMLATQLNWMVNGGDVTRLSVITLTKISCNKVQDKKLVIILGMTIIQKDVPEKIGDPKGLKIDGTVDGEAITPAAAPASIFKQPMSHPTPPVNASSSSNLSRRTNVYPIEGLSPYQNNWTIKARVSQKSDIKNWSNAKGEGKLFSITLMDESGEIKATAFNAVVDELYEKLQEGKVYFISKARVNLAKKRFNNVQNDYELGLERNTEIEECHDADNVPAVKFNFVSLASLHELPKDTICDVLTVLKDIGDAIEITTKFSKQSIKRDLTIVDKSSFSIRLTLWGKQAEQFNVEIGSVIAFKGVRVGDFGGRTLTLLSSSTMMVDPDIPDAHVLKGWYDSAGTNTSYQSHSGASGISGSAGVPFNRAEMRSLHDVKQSQTELSDDGPGNFYSSRATIMHIKADNILYPACPNAGCNKKVMQGHDGWRCEKCDRSFEAPQYRFMLSMAVADWSGQLWLQGFNDVGETIFEMSGDKLHEIQESDAGAFNAVMQKALTSTYNFSCRAKKDNWNDQVRIRNGISKMAPLDYKVEAAHIRDLLNTPWARG